MTDLDLPALREAVAKPTPYYEHAGITIYHGDCRDILPYVTADVVVTDPPYNVGKVYGLSVDDSRDDYEAWCRSWFTALHAPTIAFTCGHRNVTMWGRIQEPDWIICWFKPAAMVRSPFGACNWEPVMFYGDTRTHKGCRVDVVRAGIVPIPDSCLSGHPCPKPDQWAVGLVRMLSDAGETILDPFMGSGTTLVAAKQLVRKAIGIEIEERYCEIAVKRLAQEVLPLEPHEPEPTQGDMLEAP